MMDRQIDAIADGDIANIEVAAPFALAVEARCHFAIGSDADGTDEGRDWPGDCAVEVEGAVASCAARARCVLEDLGGVFAGQFGPTRQFASRASAWANGNPRVAVHGNRIERDDEHIAALRSFDIDRACDRVGQWRRAIEAGPFARDRFVRFRLEETRAGVKGFQLEGFARLNAKEWFVAPVERIFAGLFTGDALHSYTFAVKSNHRQEN